MDKEFLSLSRFLVLFLGIVFLANASVVAQNQAGINDEPVHEVSIFVMPTMYPVSWTSPSELYKTMYLNYIKSFALKNSYLLGHLAVQVNSPLLADTILTGMAAQSSKEKTDIFLKDKIGFGVLGVAMKGKLEKNTELKKKFEIYKRRHKLAFITFKVNANSIKRIQQFIEVFSKSVDNLPASSNYYGGSFWPLYAGEGAGCSAFGLALLDAAKILPTSSNDWLIRVNIPMSIIGGEFNNNRKIKFSEILKTKSWASSDLKLNVDYIPFQIYDPSKIYRWIKNERLNAKSDFVAIEKDNVPGLYLDCRTMQIDENIPVFTVRPTPDFFVDFFKKKLETSKKVF